MLHETGHNLDADCKSETTKSCSNKSEYDDRSINNLTNIDYINLAALFNYHDDKCKEHFSDIFLPTITVSYNSLTQLFFDRREKIFTTYCLDTIWDSIQGLKLSNIFLKKYVTTDKDKIYIITNYKIKFDVDEEISNLDK